MTKQATTRDLVLDLIEQLAVGEAIPSERQLSSDFGVSRLTVRAALDDLVREGYLVRRHGSGTFVSEPKIAQELTMTSFTDDMRRRGLQPASKTLDLRVTPAGARLGRLLHVSPSEPVLVAVRLRLADGESMAIETVHIRADAGAWASLPPTSRRCRSTSSSASGTGSSSSGGEQTIEPTVTDEDESSCARRPAPLACVQVRAHHALPVGRDRRVRRVDLPWGPVPARHRPLDSSAAQAQQLGRAARCGRRGEAWLVPTAPVRSAPGRTRCEQGFVRATRLPIGLDRRSEMWKPPARGRLVQTTWRSGRRLPRSSARPARAPRCRGRCE